MSPAFPWRKDRHPERYCQRLGFPSLGQLAALVLSTCFVHAAAAQTLRVVPSITLKEGYSDNVSLVPDDLARSGWVTEFAPALRADLAGARVKGFLDYRAISSFHSRESQLDDTQHFLSAFANIEAVEGLAFLDARANILPLNRSAFGASASPDSSTPSANRVEATSYLVAPTLRGRISDVARYQVRLNAGSLRVDDGSLPTTQTTELAAKISNASSAKVGWALEAFASRVRNDAIGSLDDSRFRGSLVYAFDPQIHGFLIAGHETTDFAGPPRSGTFTRGGGVEWSPSVRTQLSGVYERRFFGNGHSAMINHRTPLTAWKLVSTKDATVLPAQLAAGSSTSIQSVMAALLTSAIPDPDQRAEAVRRRLDETGISEFSPLSTNVFTTRPYIFRNDGASFAMLGATNTVSITLTRRQQRAFGVSILGSEGLPEENFRQWGMNVDLARKLSPVTTLTLAATALRTQGLEGSAMQSNQRLYSLFIFRRLSPRTSASVGFRHVSFDSSTSFDHYRENMIFALISIRL